MYFVQLYFPVCLIKLWCAQVTLTLEESKITVLSKGTPKGLKAKIPKGGHSFFVLIFHDYITRWT